MADTVGTKMVCSVTSMDEPIPDFSIVVVGSQRYGADLVANTILGGKHFQWGRRTSHRVSNMGEVNGKQILLVKAPIWLRGYHLVDTAQLVKEELVLSASNPAPHAFILLVQVDFPFTSTCARAVEAHLELYGKNVWSHTIVLFTCVDWLGSTTIDQYIAGEGDFLAQLLKRCGGRFYTFDSAKRGKTLSEELLGKIEEMVRKNQGKRFEMEPKKLQEIHKKREEMRIKAKDRKQRNEKKTEETKAGTSNSEMTVVMLGWVFSFKSRLANAILGTPETYGRTERCMKRSTIVGGRTVTVVNTPGWWKFLSANLVETTVQSEIKAALELNQTEEERTEDQASSNTAFLLLLPVDTSFTNEQRKIVEDNMKPLGEKGWQNTIVVFTRCGWLGKYSIEEHIESEGEALIWLVEKCGNRYFVFDEGKPPHQIDPQVTDLLNMIDEMLCMNQSLKTTNTAETRYPKGATSTEEEVVDEDLKRMAGVLYKAWGWRPQEINEIRKRFKNSLQEMREDTSNMKRYYNREEMEDALRNEMREKSVEEVIEIVLEMHYRKECGAFDIVSIICEKDTFKPKWKQLFEREWSRREVRLMELLEQEYASGEEPQDDGGYDSDMGEPDPERMLTVVRWLKNMQEASH